MVDDPSKVAAVREAMRELGWDRATIQAIRDFVKECREINLRPTEVTRIKQNVLALPVDDKPLDWNEEHAVCAIKMRLMFPTKEALLRAYHNADVSGDLALKVLTGEL